MNKFLIYSTATILTMQAYQLTSASETVIVRSVQQGPQTQQIVTQQPVQIITTADGKTYYQNVAANNTTYQTVTPAADPVYQAVAHIATQQPQAAQALTQIMTQQPQAAQALTQIATQQPQIVYQQVVPSVVPQVVTQQVVAQPATAEEPKKKGFLSSLAKNVGGTMLQVALPGPIGNIAGNIVKGSD